MSRWNGYILVTANFWVGNSFLCEVSEPLLNKPLIAKLLIDVQYHLMYSKSQIFAHWYIIYDGLIMIVFNKHLFLICTWKDILWVSYLCFSNSLIIQEEKTKEITTVKEVWICDPNYHKLRRSFALIFSKNYQCFEKLYQTLEKVFHQISKHFEVG